MGSCQLTDQVCFKTFGRFQIFFSEFGTQFFLTVRQCLGAGFSPHRQANSQREYDNIVVNKMVPEVRLIGFKTQFCHMSS